MHSEGLISMAASETVLSLHQSRQCNAKLVRHNPAVRFGTGERIAGYDVARSIAVLGMILVNYHSIFLNGQGNPKWFVDAISCLYGRAAALFVTLAGVGLALMSRRVLLSGDQVQVKAVRGRLFKRSLILAVMGILLLRLWRADILHFYGVFLSAGAFLLTGSSRRLWTGILGLYLAAVSVYCLTNGEPALETFIFDSNFFVELIDDLFFGGYYAVLPWFGFLVIGLWLGKTGTTSAAISNRRILLLSFTSMIIAELLSWYASSELFYDLNGPEETILTLLLRADIFPITPLFFISAAAGAIVVIVVSLSIMKFAFFAGLAAPLSSMGKLSLSIYIIHIVVGLGIQKLMAMTISSGLYPLMSVCFTFCFCVSSIVFSHFWIKRFGNGPFEWVMRQLSS